MSQSERRQGADGFRCSGLFKLKKKGQAESCCQGAIRAHPNTFIKPTRVRFSQTHKNQVENKL